MILVDAISEIILETDAGAETWEKIYKLPKLVVTNVAKYYFHHTKEFWMMEDFPDARPPFKKLWVEYACPSHVYSKEMGWHKSRAAEEGLVKYFGGIASQHEKGEIMINGAPHYTQNGKLVMGKESKTLKSMIYSYREDGVAEYRLPLEVANRLSLTEQAQYCYDFHPIMQAFSFMSCRNVETVHVSAPVALQKARVKRGKRPLSLFDVINVLPMKAIRKNAPRERRVESTTGEGVDLEISRIGHYAHYGPRWNRGLLFGKYEGRFYIPATAPSSGRVYAVKGVDDEKAKG